MTLTFFTNFINHHQVPVADELCSLMGDSYRLVATEPMPKSFSDAGYPDYSDRPYLVKAYLGGEEERKAEELARTSDVVIAGSVDERWYAGRAERGQALFLYSERLLKTTRTGFPKPAYWRKCREDFAKFREKPAWLLCASAFAARDYNLMGAFRGKCFKWGYFPRTEDFDLAGYEAEKRRAGEIRLLWCGRMIDWKRPEMAVRLAAALNSADSKERGRSFHLEMIGGGDMSGAVEKLISDLGLQDRVTLTGNLPNSEVIERMRRSHIFLFTSTRQEGWGAVLNEAMAAGCAVVAADRIGSVPFLINDGTNGLTFRSSSQNSLNSKVLRLVKNPEEIYRLGKNAYQTLHWEWSPTHAAENLLRLAESAASGHITPAPSGPCSPAPFTLRF